MADDKKKQKEDRNLISFKEKYEVDYAVNQLKKQFPDQPKTDVKEALFDAAKKVARAREERK